MATEAAAPHSIGNRGALCARNLFFRQPQPVWPAQAHLSHIGLGGRFARQPTGCTAYGSFAAKTGIAKAAIEMIADTANLMRRILRVRVPVQS
jgi:hypothetical protein